MRELSAGYESRIEPHSAEMERLYREVERLRVVTSEDSQDLLEAILQHSPHGVIVCDATGKLTLHNRAAEKIWGGSATTTDMSDWSKYRAFHPNGQPFGPYDWSMARCLTERKVVPAEEVTILRFDGTRSVILGSCAPVISKKGQLQGAIAVFADITELRALASAERAARNRSDRLGQITAALVRAVTPSDVLKVVNEAVLTTIREILGANWASLYLLSLDGTTLETVSPSSNVDLFTHEKYRRFSATSPNVIAAATQARQLVLIETPEELARRFPGTSSTSPFGSVTHGAIPLTVGLNIFGAINFAFCDWRPLTQDDRAFLLAAANQCALALERTRLYESESRAHTQAKENHFETDLLLKLSDAVNRAETLSEVYEPALDVVIAALRVDHASVLLVDPDRVMRFKAWRGLSAEYRRAVEGHTAWSLDDTDPQPILVPDVMLDEPLKGYADLFRKEEVRALGFFPLVHRRRLLGKFMMYSNEPRVFSARELELARTIAGQIAQAVARIRLLESERHTRELIRRLQAVTARLSEAVTPEDVARVIVTEGVAATGASTGGLWMLASQEQVARLAHSEGYSEHGRQGFSVIDLKGRLRVPVMDALRTGEPVWIESTKEFAAEYPDVAAVAQLPDEYRIVCLPIKARGQGVGVLAFTFNSEPRFESEERDFFLNIARQGSLALERSQLFEVETRARAEAEAAYRRASFKADASAALAASLDYETTLKNVAKLAVPRFADWCGVELLGADEKSKLVAVAHVDPSKVELAWRLRERYPPDANAPHGVLHVLRTGVPELYEEISDEVLEKSSRGEEHLALTRSLGLKSAIIAPMTIHGRTVGAISFISAESGRRYETADLEMAVLLGQRAALAIENSKLHGDMERAVRARDDLLAVVSHDLRNPLGIVSMKAEQLSKTLPSDDSSAKARKHVERIKHAAEKMDGLINDLLDVGSVERGQLKLELAPNDLWTLLSAAVEEMSPIAGSKGVHLQAKQPTEPCLVRCDSRRVLQVLSNLIGNAIKFSPSGASIRLDSYLEGKAVAVTVSDSGPGIDAGHLSRIFERYYQAPSSERSGVGLGLFIAKGIVTAHGGRIWAESTPGVGSRFCFTLPLDEGVTP